MPLNDNNSDFKMKTAEFRGYTIKALEDLDRNDIRIEKKVDALYEKIDSLHKQVTNQTIKFGIISGVMGMVMGLVISALFNVLIA